MEQFSHHPINDEFVYKVKEESQKRLTPDTAPIKLSESIAYVQ